MEDLRGVHFSAAAAVGGGYARSWVLLLLLGASTEGASAAAAGADCGCYWKKLWQTIASYIDFSFSDFDFALSLVLFSLHVLVWRYLLLFI